MSEKRQALLFIVPSVLFLAVLYYYPVWSAVQHSLYKWDGVNADFVGLQNFVRMFKDEWFLRSLVNLGIVLAIRLAVGVFFPLMAAILVSRVRSEKVRYGYRVAFVVPMVVTFVVVILLWQFIFEYQSGLLNTLLRGVGLGALAKNWLGTDATALYAIALIGFPWVTSFNYGLYFLMFAAGLDNIPKELHDAARIDGANSIGRLWFIDLPMILGQIRMVIVLSIVNNIQYFVPVLMMTMGGPGIATMMPGLVMYFHGFRFTNMGYASAIGLVLSLMIFGLSWINMRLIRSNIQT